MSSLATLYYLLALWVSINATMLKQFTNIIRPADVNDENAPKDQWFEQDLDQFDITNPNTWKQRYHVIDEYYKPGGPAFLALDGEWESSGKTLLTKAATTYAKKLNAIVFQLEHRYYGQSRPTSDLSLSNLRYLTTGQALMDTAYFIAGMNSQHKLPEKTKWVVFGGSYAANLAAWTRDKFPHLVYASVAYSAPVLAKLNYHEFKSYVRDIIKGIDNECVKLVKGAHLELKKRLKESTNLEDLEKKFILCDPIDPSIAKDVESLLEVVADTFVGLVQYNHQGAVSIDDGCAIMKNPDNGDVVDRYANLTEALLKDSGEKCLDYKYSKKVETMKNISWESERAIKSARQWMYQTCTEYGYFQTSYQKSHLFSDDIPLDYYLQLCVDIYGEQFNKQLIEKGIAGSNIYFGGKDIKATRVAYVFGSQDPWSPLGITSTIIQESPSIIVQGESHCACSFGYKESAPEEVKAACDRVESFVTQWCNE